MVGMQLLVIINTTLFQSVICYSYTSRWGYSNSLQVEYFQYSLVTFFNTGEDLGGVFEDYDADPCDPDAGLSSLQRLEKYCMDENMYTR